MKYSSLILLMVSVFSLSACAEFTKPSAANPAATESMAYTTCGGCHGPQQVRVPMIMSPNIIGQKKGYLAAKLKDFRAGKRIHPYMNGVVANMTDVDITNLAAFYGDYEKNHP